MILSEPGRTAPLRLAIVGGGFSGAMTAANLLWQLADSSAPFPAIITLFERGNKPGTGLAYGTCQEHHLLNTPVSRMSARQDDPDHFYNWLATQPNLRPEWVDRLAFVPRYIYGHYIQATLEEARQVAASQLKAGWLEFTTIQAEVIGIERLDENGFRLTLADGSTYQADRVALALGNLPPTRLPVFEQAGPRYKNSLWQPDALTDLDPQASVLLIGSGLTMVDSLLSLRAQGHQGSIRVISRRGLVPQYHDRAVMSGQRGAYRQVSPAFQAFLDGQGPNKTRQILRLVRREVEEAARQEGADWRNVLERLRPLIPRLWDNLPPEERARFLRHLRPYWETHRHRLAPHLPAEIERLRQSGQVSITAGRVVDYKEGENTGLVTVRLRHSKREETWPVDRIINCTGSNLYYPTSDNPLLQNLLGQGLAQPGLLGLGLATDEDGQLISATTSEPVDGLYILGPARIGQLWETTAVAELRVQAAKLAGQLLQPKPQPVAAARR